MTLYISHTDPSSILHVSQKAPILLSAAPPASKSFPMTLFEKSETPASWTDYERMFLSCLRASDDASAHLCLERLTARFGASDHRVMGLRGMYQEATADGTAGLEEVLQSYEGILQSDPMNLVCCYQSDPKPLPLTTLGNTQKKDSYQEIPITTAGSDYCTGRIFRVKCNRCRGMV